MPPRPSSVEPPDFPSSQLFLRRLAYSLVHDEARAEDLVQDTWAAWAEHRPSGVAEPKAWLARVLRNRAFNLKRNDERRARREAFAGRPDPSTPETDGTLEAQAKLIEALRELEEPYRSTLVQRYYHDLAPKAIAERSGTPLNTVKARLVRGLEKLRAAMDSRYRGDRGAWCHWLTVLGGSAAPIPLSPGAAAPGAPLVGLGASASPWSWLGVALLLAAGATWKAWPRTPGVEVARPPARDDRVRPHDSAETRFDLGRVPVVSEERDAEEERGEPELGVLASRPDEPNPLLTRLPPALGYAAVEPPARERIDFDWPQYAGGPTHDNYRTRSDEILSPKVLWFVPGCVGPPTLSDGDLYSGGAAVLRIDPSSGEVLGSKDALEMTLQELIASGQIEAGEADTVRQAADSLRASDPNSDLPCIAGAPVLTSNRVIVRRSNGGGVSAFDRKLEEQIWSWQPEEALLLEEDSAQVSLCLASAELVLVPYYAHLVALRVADGQEAWRFSFNGRINLVPACADGRVFFGMDRGLFYALDLETGSELWHATGGSFRWTSPVVVGRRVLAADCGGLPSVEPSSPEQLEDEAWQFDRGQLHSFDMKSGKELWRTEFEGFGLSTPGLAAKRDYVVAGFGQEVARFALSSGKRDKQHRVKTGSHPFGSPTVVGTSLVFGDLDGSLYVHEFESGELRWAFRPSGAKVYDFVHTGKRIFVSTSIGLFCLGDDPTQAPVAPGFVLEWSGDTTKASFVAEKR